MDLLQRITSENSIYNAGVFFSYALQYIKAKVFNPLMGALKLQRNGPFYSNTVIDTLVVDEWAVLLHFAQRGGARVGCGPA